MFEVNLHDDFGPPVLKDTAPKQQHQTKIDNTSSYTSPYAATPPGSGGGRKKKRDGGGDDDDSTPKLSKDTVSQLKDLDKSPGGGGARRKSQPGHHHHGLSSSSKRQMQEDEKNLSQGRTAGMKAETAETNPAVLESARELQEEYETLEQLVEAQRKAALEGRFLEAHNLQKKVKAAAKSHQQHVDNDLHYTKMQAILSSREITHGHREKLMIFTTEWEKQLAELERRAAEERNDLSSRHQRELAEQEEILRTKILNSNKGHKTKQLTEAEQTMQRLAAQQFYYEAHQAQLHVDKIAARDKMEAEKKCQRELNRRMNALRTAKSKEMAALEARIDSAREALLTQRARDYEVLVLKQFNKQVTDEQKVRVEFGQRRTEVQRKMVGVQTRLGKKTMSVLPPIAGTAGSAPGTSGTSRSRSTLNSGAGNNRRPTSATGKNFLATPAALDYGKTSSGGAGAGGGSAARKHQAGASSEIFTTSQLPLPVNNEGDSQPSFSALLNSKASQ